MNDILSTIQDLQNNPSASSKLPNTEFHGQTTKLSTKADSQRLSSSPQLRHHQLMHHQVGSLHHCQQQLMHH